MIGVTSEHKGAEYLKGSKFVSMPSCSNFNNNM